jgi:hypothetical protein
MSDQSASEQACPVCGKRTLALDEPPRIDVLGVQPYSDMVGMGDLPTKGAIGIVCLECGNRWRDKDAFDRNESEPDVVPEADGSPPGEMVDHEDGSGA